MFFRNACVKLAKWRDMCNFTTLKLDLSNFCHYIFVNFEDKT